MGEIWKQSEIECVRGTETTDGTASATTMTTTSAAAAATMTTTTTTKTTLGTTMTGGSILYKTRCS